MPMKSYSAIVLVAAIGLALGCAQDTSDPEVPPTGIDRSIPIAELPGWQDVKSEVGEPSESTRLEGYLELFREALEQSRLASDPEVRLESETGWWAEAERALTSMVGEANAQILLQWMEDTWGRRTGGES